MTHPLEKEYGLSAEELLDAVSRRFRAKVAVEGVVAEVHLRKQVQALAEQGAIERFEEHDQDGQPDYTLWLPGQPKGLLLECKNVRDSTEAYREKGEVVAYKVETQKTRTSNNDPSSRFYDADYFDLLAVCLGKKTKNWKQFLFIRARDLPRHKKYPEKIAVMHRVPLPGSLKEPWRETLGSLLEGMDR